MAKSEKKREPRTAADTKILPMELRVGDRLTDDTGEWEVIGRPYTTAGGKTAHVGVQRVGRPDTSTIRFWGTHDPRGQLLRALGSFSRYPFRLVRALLVLAVCALTGCTLASSPSQGPILAPTWRPGDEWVYRSEGPQGKNISKWSVVRLETVAGTECYVVKSGETGEVYFRRADLAWTMDKVSDEIESRATPPDLRYVWPLEVGKRWDVTYILNRPIDRTIVKRQRECEVLARETVSVPAGTFETVKIGCRDKQSGAATYEAWYAPAVKQFVRWHGHWADGLEKRELIRFTLN